ncbi:MAG: PAS domain S-box protein [Methanomassiliicoccales archaeon]
MMQVLYVDDEIDLLTIGKEFMEQTGTISVETAVSGKAALERVARKDYDAIVSDYQMPGMDGIALLKQLRQSGNDVPFIIFTGKGREEVVIEAINNGADFYMQKGSDVTNVFAELLHKISQAVARKHAERRIAESEVRLRAIIESSSDVVWEVDREGIYTYLSPNSSVVLGRHPAELLGTKMETLIIDQDRDAIWTRMRSAFEHGDRVSGLCYSMRKGSGMMEVETSARPVLDFRGERMGFAGITKDVTEIKHALSELKRQEERFRSMVETTPDCLWELDGDHRLIYISPQCEAITGFTPAEMIGGTLLDHVLEAEREATSRGFRERLQKDGGLRDFQCRALRKDGVAITLEANAIVMRSDGKVVGVRGQSRDASRRLATERALRHANSRLSLLSSITRHDIMNQVMVLKGYLELQESMAQDERRKVNLVRIREAAEKIQEQLTFAKQYERMGLDEPAWIPLDMIGEKLVQEATSKGIACNLSPIEYEVYADNMLDKVFFNLLDNSVRHGKRVTRISLRTEEEVQGLCIIYEDNGVGVADKDRPKLFHRGFGSNTGMGLFLAKEILSITDFSITEDGSLGTGVRFSIRVPRGQYRPAQTDQ